MELALSLKECPQGGHITDGEIKEIISRLPQLKAGLPITIPLQVFRCLRCRIKFLARLYRREYHLF